MIKIVYYPNPSGSRYWRLEDPAKYLNRIGEFDMRVTNAGITEEIAEWGDIHILQSCVDKDGIALLHYYQQEKGKKLIVEADDFIEINPDNPHSKEHKMTGAREIIEITMGIADAITTTTDYLAEKLKKYNENVFVLPNYMDMERWNGDVKPNTSDIIRIGWVGSITHLNDIKSIEKPLKHILDKYKNVQLVIMGDLRFREYFKGYNVECMLGVPFESYPAKLRGLRLDIGIAPLVDNEFNRAKSNIKATEYGLCSVPVLASNVEPYKGIVVNGENGFLINNDIDWVDKLELLINNESLRQELGKTLNDIVLSGYDLSKHIDKWGSCYKKILSL